MNSQFSNRQSPRLHGYDYSLPGAYSITLVAYHRECLFGNKLGEKMQLNKAGIIVEKYLTEISIHYPWTEVGVFVVMPKHVHVIIFLNENTEEICKRRSHEDRHCVIGLPSIIGTYKSFTARKINHLRKAHGTPVWQRSYYDHIIRNDDDLRNIWQYIESNPQNWRKDELHE